MTDHLHAHHERAPHIDPADQTLTKGTNSLPPNDQHLNRTAASATLHCLTGCAIGEVLGFILGSAYGLSGRTTILLAVALAFVFGYALSMLPLLRAGLTVRSAIALVLAADTLSIVVMEAVDNSAMAIVPGAMSAGLPDPLFWVSMTLALSAAFLAAWPVNRYLLRRGKGHALVHAVHHGPAPTTTPVGWRRWIPNIQTTALAACILAFQLGGFAAALGSSLETDKHPGSGVDDHSSAMATAFGYRAASPPFSSRGHGRSGHLACVAGCPDRLDSVPVARCGASDLLGCGADEANHDGRVAHHRHVRAVDLHRRGTGS